MWGSFSQPGQPAKPVWGAPNTWDKSPEQFKRPKWACRKDLQQAPQDPNWGSPGSWGQPVVNSNGGYNYNSWGNPNTWNTGNVSGSGNSYSTVNAVEGKSANSWGQPTAVNAGKWSSGSSMVQTVNPNGYSKMWGNSPNITWQQKQSINLSEEAFFEYLKKSDIDDETICILVSQGIHSLIALRQCTQQSLASKGINLKDVLRLKSL